VKRWRVLISSSTYRSDIVLPHSRRLAEDCRESIRSLAAPSVSHFVPFASLAVGDSRPYVTRPLRICFRTLRGRVSIPGDCPIVCGAKQDSGGWRRGRELFTEFATRSLCRCRDLDFRRGLGISPAPRDGRQRDFGFMSWRGSSSCSPGGKTPSCGTVSIFVGCHLGSARPHSHTCGESSELLAIWETMI
jgi:hypothetical protein